MNWHIRYMELAKHVASWSKDPSTKVGAVIAAPDKVVVGLGYNGFPRGIEDSEERLHDRETKLSLVVHAEANAILNATKSVQGCSIYTYPLPPCSECAKLIIQAGIKSVYFPYRKIEKRWQDSVNVSLRMFADAGLHWETVKLKGD